jgi:UDP-2,4-diacetamido-2,4,6-trideoxy-beta-L-altropyranose hydrolase
VSNTASLKIIVFRVDASVSMGTGHAMRCMTLAEEAKEHGFEVHFISREHVGHLCDILLAKGYHVHRLAIVDSVTQDNPTAHDEWLGASIDDEIQDTQNILQSLIAEERKINVLVVDHYALDARWEQAMRNFCESIVVIDDVADRVHDCDVLIDQNLYDNAHERYMGKVPSHCKMLLGPEYAILRKEFREARTHAKVRTEIKRVLVFYGGADPSNETEKALHALRMFCEQYPHHELHIDVVVGSANPNKELVKRMSQGLKNCTYHENISNMAELMLKADLALGAGGTTTWERCVLGLPAIVTIIAENQREVVFTCKKYSLILGYLENYCTQSDYLASFKSTFFNSQELSFTSHRCLQKVSTTWEKRFINYTDKLIADYRNIKLRMAKAEDMITYYTWVNDESVRANSFSSRKIELEEHKKWFEKKLFSSESLLLLTEFEKVPIGQIRFDMIDSVIQIDFSVDREYRGKGIGVWMLRNSLDLVRKHFRRRGSSKVIGKVKKMNRASIKAFKSAEFVVECELGNYIVFSKVL